jgi:hypothetical protein
VPLGQVSENKTRNMLQGVTEVITNGSVIMPLPDLMLTRKLGMAHRKGSFLALVRNVGCGIHRQLIFWISPFVRGSKFQV